MPGYYNTHAGPGPMYSSPGVIPGYGYPYPPTLAQQMSAQNMAAPGHSIVIQPGMHGQPPTVTQNL